MADVRTTLLDQKLALTPSEEKIVQILLADYPASGLGTASNLAKKAGVSDATVVRLAVKLGFEGFPDLQKRLLSEVEARLHSPLLMMETKRPNDSSQGIAESYLHAVSETIDRTIGATPANTYDKVSRIIMEAKGRVGLVGGRFSRHIAGMLAGYLSQLRPNVHDIGTLAAQSFDILVDYGKRDVLIVFDYRRYQNDVVAFASQAAESGTSVVLFTDQWLSPIAEHAEVTIICPLDVPSPYDTLAPAVAQIEALVAQILSSLDDTTRRRVESLEAVRARNAVTLDGGELAETPSQPGPKRKKGTISNA
ncbi:MurR/RpiR family transcriptional regulator [Rhizobium sp. Rhizsp42]|uniref:MurR/RpiR family transcriptional regulator n=1 Tax=Rhizobium sp. Rhizsp42 TaxID=3243034 RepID=UPI0039AEC493